MIRDTWLKAKHKKSQEKEIIEPDDHGLFAFVRKSGTISFQQRLYLADGKRIKITLGKYPQMKLAEARKLSIENKEMAANGHDPRLKRKTAKLVNIKAPTVNKIFYIWFDEIAVNNRVNPENSSLIFNKHINPAIGELIFEDVSRFIFVKLLKKIAKKVPATAQKILIDLKHAAKYAVDSGYIENGENLITITSSTLNIKFKAKNRTLDDDEIRTFYKALGYQRQFVINHEPVFLELLLFYGCRVGELRIVEKSHLDFKAMQWIVPPENHKIGFKTKKPIIRPILPEMRHLWEKAISMSISPKYVFNLYRHGKPYKEHMTKSIANNMTYLLWRHITEVMKDEDGNQYQVPRFSTHDLRRTARSRWSPFGSWVTCEKMVGHKINQVADIYDQHHYTKEMVPIYEQWWSTLKALQMGDKKIVPFTPKTAEKD